MLRGLRSFVGRHLDGAILSVLAFVAAGYAVSLFKPAPAVADQAVDDLKKTALSDLAIEDRLVAVEGLRRKGGTSALDALKDVAKEGDLPVAAAACAALGRAKSSGSKDRLKALLETSALRKEVRITAGGAIAWHWKDADDEDYLQEKMDDNGEMESHFQALKTAVFDKEGE